MNTLSIRNYNNRYWKARGAGLCFDCGRPTEHSVCPGCAINRKLRCAGYLVPSTNRPQSEWGNAK